MATVTVSALLVTPAVGPVEAGERDVPSARVDHDSEQKVTRQSIRAIPNVHTRALWTGASAGVAAQVDTAALTGWTEQDLGSPALAGAAMESQGVFTINAAGADIWGAADQFHFVYLPLTGDGTITARVVSLTATDVWAKAGVMMRETLDAGSKHAHALVSSARGTAFQRRPTTNGGSVHTGSPGAAAWWVRLSRRGDVFQASQSSDGITWQSAGLQTIAMLPTIYVGLAVTSHNPAVRATAQISNVSLWQPLPGNQPPAVTMTSPVDGATLVAPGSITVTADATDIDGSIRDVAFYANDWAIGTDTSAPYSVALNNVPAGTYRFTAVATDSGGATTASTAVNVTVQSPPPAAGDIVFHAEDVAVFAGAWTKQADATAADGLRLATPNAGLFVSTPLAAPADYFEVSFDAAANTPYRLWLRLRGAADSKYNESVWVQFSDSVDGTGAARYRIGTTSALLVNLENCYNCGIRGWGWQNRAYWLADSSVVRFATSGTQTLRVQVREDGVMIDQIVLSPSTYMNIAPGMLKDDTSIVSRQAGTNQPPLVALTSPAGGFTFGAPAMVNMVAAASDADGSIARVEFYAGATLLGADATSPYSLAWNVLSPGGYTLTAVAVDNTGTRTTSAAVTVTANPSLAVFTASADHDTLVTSYRLEIFVAGADPNTAAPVAVLDLGKPAPVSGNITADITAILRPLASGNYIATVSAIGSSGAGRSTAAAFVR